MAVYPDLGIQTSAIYQNSAALRSPHHTGDQPQIAPSRGRISAPAADPLPATGISRSAHPYNTVFEPLLQNDLSFLRLFRFRPTRIRAGWTSTRVNAKNLAAMNTTTPHRGSTSANLGGRLMRVGAQLEF